MNILRTAKKIWWTALLAMSVPSAWGYALLGPLAGQPGGEPWQTPTIGYGLAYLESLAPGGPVQLGDIGGPHNWGQGYRRNAPVLYYTCDANFLGFFGSNGLVEIDKAFAIMNNAMTNNPTGVTNGVDGYSASLSEFPPESAHVNFEAQALFLTDLKSVTLHAVLEQMGLAEPERFTWTLAERDTISPPGCPLGTEYLVVQRNFGITPSPQTAVQYSPYVNDTLYSYFIVEFCRGPNPLAFTVPFNVDPFANQFTSVAANNFDGLNIGGFYTGLTRDDVGGLRYLLTSNNVVTESPSLGSLLVLTNLGNSVPLTTLDLHSLLLGALTNDPALVPVLFPGTVVASTSNFFTVLCTPNVISYLTNFIGEPVGTPAHFIIATNGFTCVPQQLFVTTFANVISNANLTNFSGIVVSTNIHLTYSTNTAATVVTTSLGVKNGAPVGSPPVTNTTTKAITITNQASGEYFLLPAGQCGWRFLSPQPGGFPITNVVVTTNIVTAATNVNGFVDTQSIVTRFTNHTYIVQPISCSNVVDVPRQRQGVKKVQFVRADFDSLIGQFFQPVTNFYTMTILTNSQWQVQRFQRVRTAPDFLLTADDNIAGNTFNGTIIRNIIFNDSNAGFPGPGIINSATTISYNRVGSAFENGLIFAGFTTNAFASEFSQMPVLQWASFDASTNEPVVYPNGTDIQNLINQALVQVTPPPPTLSDGMNSLPYGPIAFTATGGAFAPPFTWSATGLPTGMTMDADGTLSGTPTDSGTFDFTVVLTDSLGRSVQWDYTIVIQ